MDIIITKKSPNRSHHFHFNTKKIPISWADYLFVFFSHVHHIEAIGRVEKLKRRNPQNSFQSYLCTQRPSDAANNYYINQLTFFSHVTWSVVDKLKMYSYEIPPESLEIASNYVEYILAHHYNHSYPSHTSFISFRIFLMYHETFIRHDKICPVLQYPDALPGMDFPCSYWIVISNFS